MTVAPTAKPIGGGARAMVAAQARAITDSQIRRSGLRLGGSGSGRYQEELRSASSSSSRWDLGSPCSTISSI